MGRGRAWLVEESVALVKAWMSSVEENCVKNWSSSKELFQDVYKRFCDSSPKSKENDVALAGYWTARSQLSAQRQFARIAADVERFDEIRRSVVAKQIMEFDDATVEEVNRIALAVYLGKASSASREALKVVRALPAEIDHEVLAAWKLLHEHPLWCTRKSTSYAAINEKLNIASRDSDEGDRHSSSGSAGTPMNSPPSVKAAEEDGDGEDTATDSEFESGKRTASKAELTEPLTSENSTEEESMALTHNSNDPSPQNRTPKRTRRAGRCKGGTLELSPITIQGDSVKALAESINRHNAMGMLKIKEAELNEDQRTLFRGMLKRYISELDQL